MSQSFPRRGCRRGLARSLAGLLAALGVACGGGLEATPLDLAAAPELGWFLEKREAFTSVEAPRVRAVDASRTAGFEPTHERIVIDAPYNALAGRLEASLWSGSLDADAAFVFPCRPARLRWWTHGSGSPQRFRLLLDGSPAEQEVRPAPGSLSLHEVAIPEPHCQGRSELVVSFRPLGSGVTRVSPPRLIVPDPGPGRPNVILVSLDTLRSDYWDRERDRPESLRQLAEDAVRFTRAVASSPTTPPSHSTLFSGLYPARLDAGPALSRLSFVSDLRAAGYTTLAFVAGGFMRSEFGFSRRAPGFALGFDLYFEGMFLQDPDREWVAGQHESALASEAAMAGMTHTLGASMERSLRWFALHPREPAFHFVHGYDVHEYRSVARAFWEEALEAHVRQGGSRAAVSACTRQVDVQMNRDLVVHHRFEPREGFRHRVPGKDAACHALLASVIYDARVRSVERTLARYLDALRELGLYDDALILVTSDHGEGLLDEQRYWGHNQLLANNMKVPLWVKWPGNAGGGRRDDRLVGLVDVRATLAELLGLPDAGGDGKSFLGDASGPRSPIQLSSYGTYGFMLADGTLCRWTPGSAPRAPELLQVFDGEFWTSGGERSRGACSEAQRSAGSAPDRIQAPEIPGELRDELRALGYAE